MTLKSPKEIRKPGFSSEALPIQKNLPTLRLQDNNDSIKLFFRNGFFALFFKYCVGEIFGAKTSDLRLTTFFHAQLNFITSSLFNQLESLYTLIATFKRCSSNEKKGLKKAFQSNTLIAVKKGDIEPYLLRKSYFLGVGSF